LTPAFRSAYFRRGGPPTPETTTHTFAPDDRYRFHHDGAIDLEDDVVIVDTGPADPVVRVSRSGTAAEIRVPAKHLLAFVADRYVRRRLETALENAGDDVLLSVLQPILAYDVREARRETEREHLLRRLAEGINDLGTQIPDHSPGADRWYEILKSVAGESAGGSRASALAELRQALGQLHPLLKAAEPPARLPPEALSLALELVERAIRLSGRL
jgi:hypothetical protein